MALSGIPDSKIPMSITGYFLKQVAAGAGVDIARIEKKQGEKVQIRVDNQEVKIALYKKRIKRHQEKRPPNVRRHHLYLIPLKINVLFLANLPK